MLISYSIICRIYSSLAFKSALNRVTYELHWFTPFTIAESNKNMMVVEISRCLETSHEGIDDFYGIECRQMYPSWLLEQFDIKMDCKQHRLGRTYTATHYIKVQVEVTAAAELEAVRQR